LKLIEQFEQSGGSAEDSAKTPTDSQRQSWPMNGMMPPNRPKFRRQPR
jgi:hypothetical protein